MRGNETSIGSAKKPIHDSPGGGRAVLGYPIEYLFEIG